MRIIHFKPSKRVKGNRNSAPLSWTVTELSGGRTTKRLGVIRRAEDLSPRGDKGPVFVAARPLTVSELESVAHFMADN
jgi:hypothetical protein